MKTMKKRLIASLPLMTAMSLGMQTAWSTSLPAPVPRIIVSAASTWGTAADSWAGYTGRLNIWVPVDIKGGWTLKFQSPELGKQISPAAFWNSTAQYDPITQIFTLSGASWNGEVKANTVLSIGFNGQGVLDTAFALEQCSLNGQPCVASVMTNPTAQQTLLNLQAGGLTETTSDTSVGGTTDPSTTDTSPPPIADTSGAPVMEVLLSVNSAWEAGYGGNIVVKNLSASPFPAGASGWKAKIKFPDLATAKDVFKSGPWNFQVAFAEDGTVTLSPASWSAALAAGDSTSSGFNGGSTANLLKAASADGSVTVMYSASTATNTNTDAPVVPNPEPINPTPTPSVTPDSGLPTGAVSSGFLFSPYKDVTISMNWNTNVISTKVTGALTPLVTVLPSKVPAVTWSFATGECGQENWAGIKPDALVAANLKAFTDSNKDYVISTGGAAGAFTCTTPEGMRTFINRYASKNLVGVDFDIEAGQSAASINSLIKQVKAVEADYPNLRFSFTVATLGSSNGQALTAPYGDLNVTGYNVLQALKNNPLTNYTINLMVMDYGPAGSGVCVLDSTGLCDMGKTAIQAAKNLTARYGIPSERIELTPMIGVNDVRDELFSLQDTDTMIEWARANHLAGVHFWSVDRDTPCNQEFASPICSSVSTVPAWGWTQRFITALVL
jgi:hypothetical protein